MRRANIRFSQYGNKRKREIVKPLVSNRSKLNQATEALTIVKRGKIVEQKKHNTHTLTWSMWITIFQRARSIITQEKKGAYPKNFVKSWN